MSYENRRPDVAVFIDFENVYVSVRDKLNANPNFEAIMDRCSDLGRVVISRAYADWYRYPRVTSALYANAIEPIYVATYYYDKDMGRTGRAIKNSVDMNLCIDAMKTLFTNTNISKFVLVTGDRDFIPLVNTIRQLGKEVYIIGIGGAASTHLAQSADEFVFYEQLIGRQPGGSAMATSIANRATELNRGIEVLYEPPPHAAPVAHPAPVAPPPPTPPAHPADPEIYAVLVDAIHLVRKRGYVSTLGSIKLVMKELMGGDFKESRYKDLNGRPFAKFKDFVVDAEKRGKVQIFTNGTVNEVFLPGEDALKLSQFAAALTEESAVEPVADAVVTPRPSGRKEPVKPAAAPVVETTGGYTGRRRRRRSRRGQGGGAVAGLAPELNGVTPEDDELDLELTPPILDDEPMVTDLGVYDDDPMLSDPVAYMDELRALDELEAITMIEVITEEQTADELASAGMPADELLDELDEELGLTDREPVAEVVAEPVAEVVAEPVAEPMAEPVAEVVAEPVAEVVAEPVDAPEELEDIEEDVALAPIDFSDEEWAFFSTMMRGFSKPVSFQQIFDALRGLRKDQSLTRTNEQLRTMVKQAINSDLLDRSGKGKRVYYTLKAVE
ncbi:MAG: NYN domain-containing protein [Chloroflexales bacterium]